MGCLEWEGVKIGDGGVFQRAYLLIAVKLIFCNTFAAPQTRPVLKNKIPATSILRWRSRAFIKCFILLLLRPFPKAILPKHCSKTRSLNILPCLSKPFCLLIGNAGSYALCIDCSSSSHVLGVFGYMPERLKNALTSLTLCFPPHATLLSQNSQLWFILDIKEFTGAFFLR